MQHARRFVSAAAAVLLLAVAAPSAAQRPASGYAPPRPRLLAGADTNSAQAYYDFALASFDRKPADAAAGFYWAERLRPAWVDALYGQYASRLMLNVDGLLYYFIGDGRTLRSPAVRALDSVYVQARTLDPLMERPLDSRLLDAAVHAGPGGFEAAVRGRMLLQGWYASSRRRYADAVRAYRRGLEASGRTRRGSNPGLHAELGRVFYQMQNFDSAAAQLRSALADARRDQGEAGEDSVVIFYRPKALLEYSLGVVELARHDTAAARDAFGRALQEDLSYFPAHVRLSALALAARDTASALSELDLAVQIRGGEPALRMRYGMLLADAQRYDEALREFRKANELNPDYAEPYFVIARMYDGSDMYDEALEQYRGFAARASRDHPQLEPVRARTAQIQALLAQRAAAAAAPSPPTP